VKLEDSVDLLRRLQACKLDVTARDPRWWPDSGSFRMVVGAILTQQTRYQKVEESLQRLQAVGEISPERLLTMEAEQLRQCIQPSGFYRVKAGRLQWLARNLLEAFGDFETFQRQVDREWLLRQQGVGNETADAILCYGCHREAMVVDAYTERLLRSFGLRFRGYLPLQAWLADGIEKGWDEVQQLLPGKSLAEVHALYHGLIVEYAKRHSHGKTIDVAALSHASSGA